MRKWRWYVKHIETFIKTQNGNKIKSLSAADNNRYVEMIGRQNRLEAWPFTQHINAIQIGIANHLRPLGVRSTFAVRLNSSPHQAIKLHSA